MNNLMSPSQMKYGVPLGMMMTPMTGAIIPNEQTEVTQEKILKDQNFLSSDDKLYEGIIYHCLSLKNAFSECQFSEKLLGNYLFRAIKKNVYDANTNIFDETNKTNYANNNNLGIKEIEIVENDIIDIIQDNGKVPKIADTNDIYHKIMERKKIR